MQNISGNIMVLGGCDWVLSCVFFFLFLFSSLLFILFSSGGFSDIVKEREIGWCWVGSSRIELVDMMDDDPVGVSLTYSLTHSLTSSDSDRRIQ